MYRKSQEKSEWIKRLYDEGVMLTEICKLTSSSQSTVKKVLAFFEIDYNVRKQEEYQKKLDMVVELYKQGKSQLFIEKELNLTRKTIRTLLHSKEDVNYRDLSDQHHIRYVTEINHHAFDELTPEVLYWIGMLYTDGHIEMCEALICLVTHNNDINHLYKFKDFLQSNREPKPDNGDYMRMRVNSKRLRDRLVELGFTPNKSVTINPHILLKSSRDFWRGCVDGDGGIYKKGVSYKSDQLFLCGTLETIFDFIIFCSENAGIKDKYPSKCQGKNLYQVHYYGEDAQKIASILYKDATIYLDRKYEVYQDWLNSPEEDEVNIINN